MNQNKIYILVSETGRKIFWGDGEYPVGRVGESLIVNYENGEIRLAKAGIKHNQWYADKAYIL